MKSAFIYLVVIIVVALIILFFVIRGILKRSKQSSQNDVNALKPGKAFYETELQVEFTLGTKSTIEQFLKEKKFRIVQGVNNGIISYSGKSENAALKGWLNSDPMALPIRLICKAGSTGKLILRFDDDYGFQVLNAAQLEKFQQLNEVKFKFYAAEIKKMFEH
jgi:hypothetical protein